MPEEQNPKQEISRRGFLGIAGSAVGAFALGKIINGKRARKPSGSEGQGGGEHRWGMSIDLSKCIGCNYCTYACQAVNDLPDDMRYNDVTLETTEGGVEYFLARPCMHCEHAPCVHVCPVGATYTREDGIVMMDYDLCIGCRYCEVACPYHARVFNWRTHVDPNKYVPQFGYPEVERRPRGVVEKCTFCVHRIDSGLERGLTPGVDDGATPACIIACPTGARVFGDLDDPESPISEELCDCIVAIQLREDLSTDPKVYYLPPVSRESAEGGA